MFKKAMMWLGVATLFCATAVNAAPPEAGKEYKVLERAQATDEKDGKVEVLEFFFYSCPHCNMLDPVLSSWVKRQGKDIAFKRIPVDFGPSQQAYQKMYYTLEAMGKLDTMHSLIFKAIHVDRTPLFTEKQIISFLVKHGIDEKKYLEISKSFAVAAKISRAKALQSTYQVNQVPTLIVGGRYETSPSDVMAGDTSMPEMQRDMMLMKVLDELVKKAQKEK
jgi:thiol:disulfide interchange protein DsbA